MKLPKDLQEEFSKSDIRNRWLMMSRDARRRSVVRIEHLAFERWRHSIGALSFDPGGGAARGTRKQRGRQNVGAVGNRRSAVRVWSANRLRFQA